jgi:hypothetical protein
VCHPQNKAEEVLFDAVPAIGYVTCTDKITLKTILWNKGNARARCKDLGKIDHGIEE